MDNLNNMDEIYFLNYIKNLQYKKHNYCIIFDKIITEEHNVFFEILLKYMLSNINFIELDEEILFYIDVISLCILKKRTIFNISNMIDRMNNSGICLTNTHYDFLCLLNYENDSIFDSHIFTNDVNESIKNAHEDIKKQIIFELKNKKKIMFNPYSKSKTYQTLKLDIFKNIKFYIICKNIKNENYLNYKNILNCKLHVQPLNQKNNFIDALDFSFQNIIILYPSSFILTHGYKINILYFKNLLRCLKYSNRIHSLMFCDTIKNIDGLIPRVFNNLHLKIEIISFL
jgi:hypothetical protein